VTARLDLPNVGLGEEVRAQSSRDYGLMEISGVSVAVVDGSATQRELMQRVIATAKRAQSREYQNHPPSLTAQAFPSCKAPTIAGATAASIESFAFGVTHLDIDVVLVDQHFGPVLESTLGTDLVREIRGADLAAGMRRLIYIMSENDTREDTERYLGAGADGHLAKSITGLALRTRICEDAAAQPRFQGRVVAAPIVRTSPQASQDTPP